MKRSKLLSALILITLGLVLSGANPENPSVTKSQQSKTTQNSNAYAASDERGTDKSPLTVKLLNTGQSQAEATQEQKQERNTLSTNWWVVRLGVAGIGIAALQLIAFIVQAYRLKQTVDVMRDTSRRQLRAYVTPILITLTCPTLDETSYVPIPNIKRDVFRVTFKNHGQTPARQFSSHGNWTVVPWGSLLPDDFPFLDLGTDIPVLKSVGTVGPGSEWPTSFAIDPEQIKRARNREVFLYVYGHADYIDIFGESQTSPFCYIYAYIPTAKERDSFSFYKAHNDPT